MKAPYQWKSDMAEMLQAFLQVKKMTGFKYEKQERELEHFDSYYYHSGYSGIRLTKPMLDSFIYVEYARQSTHYRKEMVMNNFSCFLQEQGYPVYVPVIKSAPEKRCSHIPYIFTQEELQRFFIAIDSYPVTKHNNRNTIDPVLFRLLYGTGLRVSEALNLRVKDVNLEEGILTIRHAKNNKDRLVPVAQSLSDRMADLSAKTHQFSNESSYFFPNTAHNRIDQSTIYCRFRDYLLMADISHTAAGPRVHDLRHHFAVSCLKKWVLSGQELTNIMPYLAAYMGHSDFRGTQYYLRLTADLYPDIISRTEAEFGYIIPEGGYIHEG
jgi:site-specific recombinase XerD